MINYKEYKTILSAKNNMNIYRGCTHGCIYCDSRSEIYGMTYTFENIEVKTNAVELLDEALSKKRKKCMITTGAMTDPYIPLEKELKNTRKCLEVIEKHEFGVSLLTKSDLVLRDIDILGRINKKSKCVVQMTITTYDEELCKILEPNVCTTKRRFEVLMEMHNAGIPTVVWLTPILPFINDNEENILRILDCCKQAKVTGLLTFGIGMTLRYGNREYYFKNLEEYFPELKKEYMKKYGSSYGIKSPNSQKLTRIIKKFCKNNDVIYGEKEVFKFCTLFAEQNNQLSIFDGDQ
ncbi:MAG: radical SAM protein [Clostridiaceae bacterium]|nr:radical SAM protein [Clostridiaceae bacterium]